MSVYVDQNPMPRRIRFDWISEAFSIFGKNVGVWVGAILLYLALAIVASLALPRPDLHAMTGNPFASASLASAYTPTRTIGSNVINLILAAIFSPGLFYMANKQVRGEPISISDLFGNYGRVLPVLLYHIIYSIAVFVGIILCVIPFFFVLAVIWPGFALVADGVPVGEALSRSINGVKSDLLTGGLFMFVFILLMIVSLVPCGLGLFVTVPMLYIISSLMYRDMIGMPGIGQPNGTDGPYYSAQSPTAGVWPPAPTQGVPPVNPFPQAPNPFPQTQEPSSPFPPPSDPYASPSPPQSGE